MLDFLVGNDFLSAIIAFGLVLIPAVIIHELGHFLAAKAVGITILEFGVGYPPRIARLFNWGETEFTLNMIPLGGFVRPLGEDMIRPLTVEETEAERERLIDRMGDHRQVEDAERKLETAEEDYIDERAELEARGITNVKSVNEVKPWPRILFMSAGAIANLVSAFLIFVLIGLIGVEQPAGARVFLPEVGASSMFVDAGLVDGDYIEKINGEVFMTSRDFFEYLANLSETSAVLDVARVEDDEQLSLQLTLTIDPEEARNLADATASLLVTSVQSNSPANDAGLQPEDAIIGLAGTSLIDKDDPFEVLQSLNRENEGREVVLEVIRDGELVELTITPRVNPGPGLGHLGAGVMPQYIAEDIDFLYANGPDQIEYVPLGLGEAVNYAFAEIRQILTLIAELPMRLLSGQAQPEEGRIVSIVGITQLGGAFLQQSVQQDQPIVILNFVALISIALGITNLLPIPPLDGGRIFFALVELVRGRPVPPKIEERVLMIGLFFLLSLGVIVIINDIINPLTEFLP